jgi:hypothetical protein
MDQITIRTDHKWKRFKYEYEVPRHVMTSQFKHLLEDGVGDHQSDGFFCYRKYWYHISDFSAPLKDGPLGKWDGSHSDSYFSGIVIKLHRDSGEYMVGTYMS